MSPNDTAKRKENASALIIKCMISPPSSQANNVAVDLGFLAETESSSAEISPPVRGRTSSARQRRYPATSAGKGKPEVERGTDAFSAEDAKRYRAKEGFVYVWGRVEYIDGFVRDRWLVFMFDCNPFEIRRDATCVTHASAMLSPPSTTCAMSRRPAV